VKQLMAESIGYPVPDAASTVVYLIYGSLAMLLP
jgi:hypothetical protein